MAENRTLIFVYNADSGFVNTLFDIAHKIFSPATYACNLCAITHSATGMRDEWREYIDQLDLPLNFLHRDELIKQYPATDFDLPAILLEADGELSEFIGQAEINRSKTMDDLRSLISSKLENL